MSKKILQEWFTRVWNTSGDTTAIDDLFDEKGIAYGVTSDRHIHGPSEFKVFHSSFANKFRYFEIMVVEEIPSPERWEIAKCKVHAILAEGKKEAQFIGVAVIEKNSDNKIVGIWNYFDSTLEQLLIL